MRATLSRTVLSSACARQLSDSRPDGTTVGSTASSPARAERPAAVGAVAGARTVSRSLAAVSTRTAALGMARIFALILRAPAAGAVTIAASVFRPVRDITLRVVGPVLRWTASLAPSRWTTEERPGRWTINGD